MKEYEIPQIVKMTSYEDVICTSGGGDGYGGDSSVGGSTGDGTTSTPILPF